MQPGSAPPKIYKWQVVGLLWGVSLFNYADRQAIFSVFPLLEKELGLTPVQLGLLGSSFAWVYGLCSPFAGMIVDRVRRRSAVLGGLAFWSVICTATAISRSFGMKGGAKLRLRIEGTNLFNIVSLGQPGASAPAAGATSATFGVIRTAYTMRRLQLGLRLTF